MGTVYRHLYDQVCDWENLMRAWRKAQGQRGRRPQRPSSGAWREHLLEIQAELQTGATGPARM